MFKSSQPIKNCLLLEYKTQKELALAFCRVEEYYEGPKKVNKKYLSLEGFIDAYMTKDGRLDYFHEWTGFNIPGNVFTEWFYQNASDKTKWEIALAQEVSIQLNMNEPFYVIGGVKGDIEVIDHEIAHALFYMNKEYRIEMNDLNYNFNKQYRMQYCKVVNKLKEMGYGVNVIRDEIQAYMSTSKKRELVTRFGLDYNTILPMLKQYRKVLSRYNTHKKKG
jgi:ribosomal protein S9